MPIDENEVKGAIDALRDKIVANISGNPELRHEALEDTITAVLNNNIELVNKAKIGKIGDEQTKQIIQIAKKYHPVDNNALFQKLMNGFKEQHVANLKKFEKESKETQESADPGLSWFDRLRARYRGARLYYYVWWLFDSEKDYQELVNDPHAYPRDRGELKVRYVQIGNKDIDEALAGKKDSGKVVGQYLGALGLIGRDQPIIVEVPTINLKPGQIIALGAARAKRWDWRTREWRGLSRDKLKRFDVEKLLWKWDKYDYAHPPEKTGKIRGRLVIKNSWSSTKPEPAEHDNPKALEWAKKIVRGLEGNGLDGHKVILKYELATKSLKPKEDTTETRVVEGRSVNGIFEFEGIPFGAVIRDITSGAKKKYGSSTIEFMKIPLVFEEKTQEAFLHVVLSKEPKGPPGSTSILVEPTGEAPAHKTPLGPPFGTNRLTRIAGLSETIYFPFKITSGRKENKFYHIFIMTPDGSPNGRHVTAAELASYFGMIDMPVVFKITPGGDPKSPKYDGHDQSNPYYHFYPVTQKLTVTAHITFTANRLDIPKALFLFVSVQEKEYHDNPKLQRDLDFLMYRQAASGGTPGIKKTLEENGVLDFNFIPIILQPIPGGRP